MSKTQDPERNVKTFPMKQSQRKMTKLSLGIWVRILIVCAQNTHYNFLLHGMYGLKTAFLQRLLLWRLTKPVSKIQLYSINSACLLICIQKPASLFSCMQYPCLSCLTLYTKHTKLPESCGFSVRDSTLPNPECLCASIFFIPSLLQSRSSPWSHKGLGATACTKAVQALAISNTSMERRSWAHSPIPICEATGNC